MRICSGSGRFRAIHSIILRSLHDVGSGPGDRRHVLCPGRCAHAETKLSCHNKEARSSESHPSIVVTSRRYVRNDILPISCRFQE